MLKTLIAKLAKSLFRPKYNPGYQTRVYPRLGEMIIIHDSLDFGPIATADELKPIDDFWLSDEMPDTGLLTHNDCEDVFTFDSLPGINPASGLPMMDGLLDVVRIPRHLDTQPTIIWTLVPCSLGHLIHVHLDRQSERSDAGLHC